MDELVKHVRALVVMEKRSILHYRASAVTTYTKVNYCVDRVSHQTINNECILHCQADKQAGRLAARHTVQCLSTYLVVGSTQLESRWKILLSWNPINQAIHLRCLAIESHAAKDGSSVKFSNRVVY